LGINLLQAFQTFRNAIKKHIPNLLGQVILLKGRMRNYIFKFS
jgi:hypothetical protein